MCAYLSTYECIFSYINAYSINKILRLIHSMYSLETHSFYVLPGELVFFDDIRSIWMHIQLHFFVCFSITWISFDVFRLCDEATSALDSTTEAEILTALKSLANNRTSVFIAHRLTTAMQCDEVSILCKNYEQKIWRWIFKVLCRRSSSFFLWLRKRWFFIRREML